LPGKAARAFRRESARTVCRVLGGDPSLVQEIERRHHTLQETEGGRSTQDFLVPDTPGTISTENVNQLALMPAGFALLDETGQKEIVLDMVRNELAKRKRADEAEWHRRKFTDTAYFMKSLQEQHILDPNLHIALIDQLKNIASSPAWTTPGLSLITAETACEDLCTISGWLLKHSTIADHQKVSFTSKFGREMSLAYKKKYGVANERLTDQHVNGEVRKVMCYDAVKDGDVFKEVFTHVTA
jgi:hypothetical protein